MAALGPAESPAVIAHLGFVQAVITRVAGNSASCKTWCLAIVSALFSFAGAMQNDNIVAAALVPIVVFGLVDAAYLAVEKAYRDHYNALAAKVREGSYSISDSFNMSAPVTRVHFFKALASWSVWAFYLGLAGAYVMFRTADALLRTSSLPSLIAG